MAPNPRKVPNGPLSHMSWGLGSCRWHESMKIPIYSQDERLVLSPKVHIYEENIEVSSSACDKLALFPHSLNFTSG